MDKEDYTPYTFTKEQIEEELQFIPGRRHAGYAGADLGWAAAGAELPQTVDRKLSKPRRGIKGHPPAPRTKPATMSTGLVIQVPEYLDHR